ncbi:acyl carrier protein [Methanospirillum stamsii]|uniref:Acyl carrier protein n=1 Tax=Methanospirillum stamsii TaxID=1277351 RepID=A0A2V2MU02_9EURY|nr:phosphopantetheine-binding protein [Methanospirillum stamsii]PWR69625.1 acyl carrier protein [Methanospirillum stamsii]
MNHVEEQVKKIVEDIYKKKNGGAFQISKSTSLRNDLGFDSFDLAELTVKIEDLFGIDIFENRIVDTFEQIINELTNLRE